MEIGDRVKTLTDKGGRDYSAWAMRGFAQWGAEGVICTMSNAHRAVFLVAHEDGTSAWYDPNELEVIDPSPELKALFASLGFLHTYSLEAAKFAFPVGTRVCFTPPDSNDRIEIEDVTVGDPYEARADGTICIYVLTRNHGAILLDDLRVRFREVLKLRVLGPKGH